MMSGLVGDLAGTARLLCWEPSLLNGITPGMSVSVSNALIKEGDYGGREVVCDEETVISVADVAPDIPMTALTDLVPDQSYTVRGSITKILSAKPFTKRDGATSWVRNLRLSDGTTEVPLVLWDAEAKRSLLLGETVTIYNVYAKIGRTGETEISLGKGGALLIVPDGGEPVRIEGTVLHVPEGTLITNKEGSWLVETSLPHGTKAIMTGHACGKRLVCESEEVVEYDLNRVKKDLSDFISSLS